MSQIDFLTGIWNGIHDDYEEMIFQNRISLQVIFETEIN